MLPQIKSFILQSLPKLLYKCSIRIYVKRLPLLTWGRRGRVRMVVGFTTTYSISAHITTKVVSSRRDVLNTVFCDKVCQWLVAGRWFSPVYSTNKTDHDITEILLKVALNPITLIYIYIFFIQKLPLYNGANISGVPMSQAHGAWISFPPPPFSLLPPFCSKFSYKSFLFQNFHNHSFFLHLTISVDVIHRYDFTNMK